MYPKTRILFLVLATLGEYGFIAGETVLPVTMTTSTPTTTIPRITTTSTPKNLTFTTSTMRIPYTTITTTTVKTTTRGIGGITYPTISYIPTTTTPSLTKIPLVCNRNKSGEFQRISAAANPSISKFGTFAGYFKYRSACQKLCKQNYKERCVAYMHEPQNRGMCTIFQYNTINGKISEIQNSKASVYLKCTKPGSKSCCAPLESLIYSSNPSAEGTMLFTYDEKTCRSTATIKCQHSSDQQAAIIVNRIEAVKLGLDKPMLTATCHNGAWKISNLPSFVENLKCHLRYYDYAYYDDYYYYYD